MSFLGLDLGTTTIKVCLIDGEHKVIKELSVPHNASIKHKNPLFSEQDPKKIVESVIELVKQLDLKELKAICTSGQMHGIVLWDKNGNYSEDLWPCSNLITWMDQRCNSDFLESLPIWKDSNGNQEAAISTGYGLASLAWLHKNEQIRKEWNACGTIMDFFNFLLTKKCGYMSDQLAYSFGYYSAEEKSWQAVCKQIVPSHLLPQVVSSDFVIGKLDAHFDFCYPKDVDVLIALGDLQTSLYKVLEPNQSVLHIGTSSQLAFVLPKKPDFKKELLRVPYFNDQYLVVAASLNGGNVFELLSTKISQFYSQLFGVDVKDKLSVGKINELLDEALKFKHSLSINPLFYGERHNPNAGASIDGFQAQTSLAELFGASASGIVYNLSQMLPSSLMKEQKVKQIRLLNRAIHPIFERASQQYFEGMDILIDQVSSVSAAFGAACFASVIGQ